MSATFRSIAAGISALLLVALSGGPASAAPRSNSAGAPLCRDGGWQAVTTSDGIPFDNQGDCVQHGAHGGSYAQASQFGTSRTFCEERGGTFTIPDAGGAVLWRCETLTVFPESDLGEFSRLCVDDDHGQYTIATFRPDGSEDPYMVECVGAA